MCTLKSPQLATKTEETATDLVRKVKSWKTYVQLCQSEGGTDNAMACATACQIVKSCLEEGRYSHYWNTRKQCWLFADLEDVEHTDYANSQSMWLP